ncbi:hypothetical protein ACFLTV_01810 [Chloroflexota bacterium]
MPIKWIALRVSEAMDMVEEFINQSAEPLEQAKIVANEATISGVFFWGVKKVNSVRLNLG